MLEDLCKIIVFLLLYILSNNKNVSRDGTASKVISYGLDEQNWIFGRGRHADGCGDRPVSCPSETENSPPSSTKLKNV
jgi:hypothetical protein